MTKLFSAELVQAQDLRPGELFSTGDQVTYFEAEHLSVGEKVYVRTHNPCPPSDLELPVTRLTVDIQQVKWVHQYLTTTGDWQTVTNDDGTPATFDTQADAHEDMRLLFAEGMDDHNPADWRVAETSRLTEGQLEG